MSKSKYRDKREHRYKPVKAMNEMQQDYIDAINYATQTVVMGPAGTGKTYIASAIAANMLIAGAIDKIILTRPNVPAGRSLGFLPGTMAEKIGPWVIPFTDVIQEYMGREAFECNLKKGNIDIVPFEVMRGRTFNRAFVILDEAQNTTPAEMKMFLTRIGEDTKVVINGDIKQSDLRETSGLKVVIDMVDRQELPVPIVEFSVDDIVRSDICAMWIKAFDKEGI